MTKENERSVFLDYDTGEDDALAIFGGIPK